VNPVWVRFPLAEGDFNRIRGAEHSARVQVIAADGTVAADNGRLNFAASTVDAKTGAVQLRAEFANPTQRWLPGAFAKVRVLAGQQTAFLVPQAAVSQTDQSRQVMTVGPEGKVVPKPVTSSGWLGTDAIIVSGLNEGDMVIVDNLVKVRPGMTVQANVPAPKSAAN
jgi:membrane fusion protein, multidrug efflux system